MARRKGSSKQGTKRPARDPIQKVSPFGVRLVQGQRFRVQKDTTGPSRSRQIRDPFHTFYGMGRAVPPPIDPSILMDLAEDNPVHGACLQAKATDTAGRGWSWEPTNGQDPDAKVIQDLNDTLASLSPDYTWEELLTQAAWERDAVGYACWEVTRDEANEVAAVYPLPAWSVRATPDANLWVQEVSGRLVYFVVFGTIEEPVNPDTGEVQAGLGPENRASEILVFRGYTARSPWYGVPTWWAGTGPIAELTAIREYNVSYFKSGGQGDYSIHVTADDGDVAKGLADEIEDQLNQSQGVQHTKLVTSGTKDVGVTTTPITPATGREGHFRLRRGDLVNEVLMAHHVPPYRVGWAVLGGLGGSASTDMLNAYLYGAIKPAQRILQHRLQVTLFGPQGIDVQGYRFQLADLTVDDLQQEMALATGGISNGMLTPNEGRRTLKLPPVQDPRMDERYMTSTLVPLGTVPQPAAFSQGPRPDQLADAADRLTRAGWDPTDVLVALGLPSMRRALPDGAKLAEIPTVDVQALVSHLESAIAAAADGPILLEKSAPADPVTPMMLMAQKYQDLADKLWEAQADIQRLREARDAAPPPAPPPVAKAPVTDVRFIKNQAGHTDRVEGRRADGSLAWVRQVERNADGTVAGTIQVDVD